MQNAHPKMFFFHPKKVKRWNVMMSVHTSPRLNNVLQSCILPLTFFRQNIKLWGWCMKMALWQECMKKEKEVSWNLPPLFYVMGSMGGRRSSYYYVLFLFISVESGKVSPQKFHISRHPKSLSFCRTGSPFYLLIFLISSFQNQKSPQLKLPPSCRDGNQCWKGE